MGPEPATIKTHCTFVHTPSTFDSLPLETPHYRRPPTFLTSKCRKSVKVFRVRCSNRRMSGLAQAQRAWQLVPQAAYPANPSPHSNDRDQDVKRGARS
jgi:hypothetical protein